MHQRNFPFNYMASIFLKWRDNKDRGSDGDDGDDGDDRGDIPQLFNIMER
jgi:hypothetical protein